MIGTANAGTLGQINIRVSPEVLSQKSEAALTRITSIKGHVDQMEQAVTRSKNYWIGSAGDTHRRAYNEFRNDIQKSILRFEENAKALQMIAQNYLNEESEAVVMAEELPSDAIL
ncbi:MAG: WXG100 family type VII secretion target [Hespellia sp.]|nr:WXG100 family type VII secretion target [Hespellia sp.]